MPSLKELKDYLDSLLELDAFPHDPSNNGLQFQGGNTVRKAVFAVDASEATFSLAAALDADFIFVHHGISWGSGIRHLTGSVADRIKVLANNDISLYAAHLPLDANKVFGHNALLAEMIGLQDRESFGTYHGSRIGLAGTLPESTSMKQLAKIFHEALPSEGEMKGIGDFDRKLDRVAVISGGGAWVELFDEIAAGNVDGLITGEFTHEIWHPAMEAGVPVLGLGHYRSETPGVIAVMNTVRKQFDLETEFIDLPTNL